MLHQNYDQLVERLNRFPQGAPRSETLYKILKILFSEREAELVAMLPIRPFSLKQASKIWKMSEDESRKILEELAGRAILIDTEQHGEKTYVLPPPMAGFFEFSMMRMRDDVDQQLLGQLFHQYCNVEEDFVRDLFADGDTHLGRVYVHEPVLPPEAHVLDYERTTEVIKTAKHIGVGTCYCRHKMHTVGQDCERPKEICMTFNGVADSLTRHDFARKIDAEECLDLLDEAYENNLVQFGENTREGVSFICNCCGCCCEGLIAARRFALMRPIHTSNFLPVVDDALCNGCGRCVNDCPVEAMTLVSTNDPHMSKMKRAKLNEDICLGCGVCVRVCNKDALHLKQREERVITPKNFVTRTVIQAIERGQLQDLIFDNRVLWSHRAMAAVLGVILKLPPVKQALASKQMKSRYIEALVSKVYAD